MILTVKQRMALNKLIDQIVLENTDIEWISEDENMQYRNSIYENMLIGLGSGTTTKHYTDYNMCNDVEMTYYYQKQLKYFITLFKTDSKIKVTTYKTNGNTGMNGSSKVDKYCLII